jgi:putative flippase GtrA
MSLPCTGLLRGLTDSTLVQLFRYVFCGGVSFAIDFILLFLLTHFGGIHYLVSSAIAFGVGAAVNYGVSVLWVFDKRVLQNRLAEFAVFVLLCVLGMGANGLLMYSLTELAGLHYLISKVFSTTVTFVGNFFAKKIILFSPRDVEVACADAEPSRAPRGTGLAGETLTGELILNQQAN